VRRLKPQVATKLANAIGLEKLKSASPFLIDLCPAGEVIPSLGERDVLHAGPSLEGWREARVRPVPVP
jgi:hypothetical protein